MELWSFYSGHPELLVVPVEHLSHTGVSEGFATRATAQRDLPPGFFALLGDALQTVATRLPELYETARGQWFPPRLTNLCIVTEAATARPYYQPFTGASLLLYASDFDPAISNVEFAAYQLIHAERLGITRNIAKTLVGNLGYFIRRSDAERSAFAEAASRSTRPDAAGFRALAETMPWMGEVLHETLQPPMLRTDGLTELPGTGLLLTDEQAGAIGELIHSFEHTGRGVVQAYYDAQAQPLGGPRAGERIAAYLREERPQLLLADAEDRVIWDPGSPEDVAAIGPAAEGICDRAAIAICGDLALVHARTVAVLDRLAAPDELPSHGEEVQQRGGVYLHEDRQLMVYSLHQPGVNTKREGTPPFHAWLLGARMAHEWGHLAAEAGWVCVAPEHQARQDEAKRELAALFDAIVTRAPQKLRDQAQDQFADRPIDMSLGDAMVDMQLQRIGDYQSNVFAQALLPTEEMEAYVRVNVRPLAAESGSFLGKLARYAYEYQYLGFSKMADPEHYFFASTWFRANYVDTGVVTMDEARRMLALMGEICGAYVLAPGTLRRSRAALLR